MRRTDAISIEQILESAGHPGYIYPLPTPDQEVIGVEIRATGSLQEIIGALAAAGVVDRDQETTPNDRAPGYLWSGSELHEGNALYTELFLIDPAATANSDDLEI